MVNLSEAARFRDQAWFDQINWQSIFLSEQQYQLSRQALKTYLDGQRVLPPELFNPNSNDFMLAAYGHATSLAVDFSEEFAEDVAAQPLGTVAMPGVEFQFARMISNGFPVLDGLKILNSANLVNRPQPAKDFTRKVALTLLDNLTSWAQRLMRLDPKCLFFLFMSDARHDPFMRIGDLSFISSDLRRVELEIIELSDLRSRAQAQITLSN
ncbi:hypothetical protein [Sneathiella limimaris]|uniref:hypothetical protein n=1 Tax=Sneathiella limimaris TaxID=1964213 RepID=UPI00146AA630|nr:hypothetical protein [Sneathiella limimaris]